MGRPKTAFGTELGAILASRGMTQSSLAQDLGVSSAYISATMTGRKAVSPQRLDDIAGCLSLEEEERVRLHRAAARAQGFRIDLPEDF